MQMVKICPNTQLESVENAEWINAWQHVRRTEWRAVLGDKNDTDFVLPKKLSIPKTSRPDSAKNDEETKTYVCRMTKDKV